MPHQALSDAEFQTRTSTVLAAIEAQCDRWLQDDIVDIDTHRTGALLELSLPGGSKIVINTQPPLHELWLAARAGGYHFRWSGAAWTDTREAQEFFAVLSRETSAQAGQALQFQAPA